MDTPLYKNIPSVAGTLLDSVENGKVGLVLLIKLLKNDVHTKRCKLVRNLILSISNGDTVWKLKVIVFESYEKN